MRFERNTAPIQKWSFLDSIAHREVGCSIERPRHPVVCALDLLGLVITLVLLVAHPQKFVVAVLPMSIAVLYVASCLYHWMPADPTRQKLDHLMIAVVIAMTYVPFWGSFLPTGEAVNRFMILGVLFSGVCVMKTFFISWHKVGGALFLILGLYGTVTSLSEMRIWLPHPALDYFWVGVVLYVVQMAVYGFHWPNPLPERIGSREVQHVILLIATTLHCVAVLKYL